MRNIFRKEPYPGGKYLQEALTTACSELGDQPIDKLLYACLLGGDTGARLMLTDNQRSLGLWQKGDLQKANRMLEVWASTCMLRLLEDREDQASVIHNTARNFSGLFGSDLNALEIELTVFHEALKTYWARRSEPGVRSFPFEIAYLRHLRALGDPGVPSFDLLPKPWGTLQEMYKATNGSLSFDHHILLVVADLLLIPDVFRATMDVTNSALPEA